MLFRLRQQQINPPKNVLLNTGKHKQPMVNKDTSTVTAAGRCFWIDDFWRVCDEQALSVKTFLEKRMSWKKA